VPLPRIKEGAVQHQPDPLPKVLLPQAEAIVPQRQPEAVRPVVALPAATLRLAEVHPAVPPVHQGVQALEVHQEAALREAVVAVANNNSDTRFFPSHKAPPVPARYRGSLTFQFSRQTS